MMKKILVTSLTCLMFSLPAYAVTTAASSTANWWSPSRLYMGAYGGYGTINGAYENDGEFAQGRLTLGLHAVEYRNFSFGLEAGVQSGNDMRLAASPAIIMATGGLPIQATLKPFVDLLVTVKAQFSSAYPLFGIVKGGVAFRQLQLEDRNSSADTVRKVNGELQAGLGYAITANTMLTAFYQGIYQGSDAGVGINAVGDTTISQIPTQQAGFLGLEYSC